MIFEIRNYHFDPALFDDYKKWGESEAIPYLEKQLDLVGFWVSTSDPAEIIGREHDDLGTANVTWIIRWRDREQRNDVMSKVFATKEWEDIFSRVPGGMPSYKRIEWRFAEAIV